MAISETARRHHAELFPDHASTLAVTDPELIEISTTSPSTRPSPIAASTPGPGSWCSSRR